MKKTIFSLLCVLVLPLFSTFAQSEATLVAEKEFASAEKELDRAYQELIGILSKEFPDKESNRAAKITKKSLITSQEQWTAFRKSNAEFAAGAITEGSGGYTAEYLRQCAEITQRRTSELATILKFFKNRSG